MMNKPNWNKAPAWANWAAQDSFGGDWVYTQSYPKDQGVTNIWPRPGKGDTAEWSTIMPEGYRQPAKWPKGCAAVVHGQGGVEWVKHPSPEFAWEPEVDHAAELAEALTYLLVCTNRESVPFECIKMAQKALYEYKQSRGE